MPAVLRFALLAIAAMAVVNVEASWVPAHPPTPSPTAKTPCPTTKVPTTTTSMPTVTTPTVTTSTPITPNATTPTAATTSLTPASTTATPTSSGFSYSQSPCDVSITSSQLIDVTCSKSNRIKFIGLGDWGETTETAGVLAVRDGVVAQAQTGEYSFLLAMGDNFYANGVASINDSQWQTTWYDRWGVGANITLPWIALLGNHDHYGNVSAQIEYTTSSQPDSSYWLMPSMNFSVDATIATGEKLKLVVTDTQIIGEAADYEWLEDEFQDDSAEFVLAVGHHHAYSAAKRGDNTGSGMVKYRNLVEASTNVKAYLCGHEHDLQYLRANSTDYFMFGGGGRALVFGETYPGTSAETVYFSNSYGFALYDVDVVNRVMDVSYHVYNTYGERTDIITFTRYY